VVRAPEHVRSAARLMISAWLNSVWRIASPCHRARLTI
jgi:hypothetical protein